MRKTKLDERKFLKFVKENRDKILFESKKEALKQVNNHLVKHYPGFPLFKSLPDTKTRIKGETSLKGAPIFYENYSDDCKWCNYGIAINIYGSTDGFKWHNKGIKLGLYEAYKAKIESNPSYFDSEEYRAKKAIEDKEITRAKEQDKEQAKREKIKAEEKEIEKHKDFLLAYDGYIKASTYNSFNQSAYFIKKKVDAYAHHAVIAYNPYSKNIFIPLYSSKGKVVGIQKIYFDSKDSKFKKYNLGKVAGNFGLIGCTIENAHKLNSIYVTEGLATGLSLYSVTQIPVIITLSSVNITKSVRGFLDYCKQENSQYVEPNILIAADNDQWRDKKNLKGVKKEADEINTGISAALKAIEEGGFKNINYCFPEFSEESAQKNPTDYNDLLVLEGKQALVKQMNSKNISEEEEKKEYLDKCTNKSDTDFLRKLYNKNEKEALEKCKRFDNAKSEYEEALELNASFSECKYLIKKDFVEHLDQDIAAYNSKTSILYIPFYNKDGIVKTILTIDQNGQKRLEGLSKEVFTLIGCPLDKISTLEKLIVCNSFDLGVELYNPKNDYIPVLVTSGNDNIPKIIQLFIDYLNTKEETNLKTIAIVSSKKSNALFTKVEKLVLLKGEHALYTFDNYEIKFINLDARPPSTVFLDTVNEKGQYCIKKNQTFDINKTVDFDVDHFINNDLDKRQYLINHFIPAEIPFLITAAGGTGKSYFALQMLVAVASGAKFLEFDTPAPQPVLGYFMEEDDEEIARRLQAILVGMQENKIQFDKKALNKNLKIISHSGSNVRLVRLEGNELVKTNNTLYLIDAIQRHSAKLCILDPLRTLTDGDENMNSIQNQFIECIEGIRNTTGCAIGLVHHTSKSDKSGSRGASALVDGVRLQMSLEVVDSVDVTENKTNRRKKSTTLSQPHVILSIGKSNYTSKFTKLGLFIQTHKQGIFLHYINSIEQLLKLEETKLILNIIKMNEKLGNLKNNTQNAICSEHKEDKEINGEIIKAHSLSQKKTRDFIHKLKEYGIIEQYISSESKGSGSKERLRVSPSYENIN